VIRESGWRREEKRGPIGWLELVGDLLRQNQLSLLGDPQAILLAAVVKPHFGAFAEEFACIDDPDDRSGTRFASLRLVGLSHIGLVLRLSLSVKFVQKLPAERIE
jgi:hypothetical protein